jgi:hypothetical protein
MEKTAEKKQMNQNAVTHDTVFCTCINLQKQEPAAS